MGLRGLGRRAICISLTFASARAATVSNFDGLGVVLLMDGVSALGLRIKPDNPDPISMLGALYTHSPKSEKLNPVILKCRDSKP